MKSQVRGIVAGRIPTIESSSSTSTCDGQELDRFNDLSSLGLVLFLTQQASIPKFLELPEPGRRITPGFRSRWGRSTGQSVELYDLFLRLTNRIVAVQRDGM